MKNIIILIVLFCVVSCNAIFAQQAHFTTSGVIEFDKKVNTYALFQKMINKDNEAFLQSAFESYKKNNPQFKVLKSTLSFSENKTLFKPIESENVTDNFFSYDPMSNQNNIIYNDVAAGCAVSQKKVFEEVFLVKDSTRKINWKITDETREIAGFTCRRANAIVLDSVYVVAFYTNQIMVSGGPESFSGLPGMILGVALPHENVTWFATKVTDTTLPANTVVPPKKGKPLDNKGFRATLTAAFKSWQESAKPYFKGFLL